MNRAYALLASLILIATPMAGCLSGEDLEELVDDVLGCPECPSGLKKFSRKTGNLSVGLNQKIIDQLQNSLIYINYYFQGEPYINPKTPKQIGRAHV